jgi:hypothetical protein
MMAASLWLAPRGTGRNWSISPFRHICFSLRRVGLRQAKAIEKSWAARRKSATMGDAAPRKAFLSRYLGPSLKSFVTGVLRA